MVQLLLVLLVKAAQQLARTVLTPKHPQMDQNILITSMATALQATPLQ